MAVTLFGTVFSCSDHMTSDEVFLKYSRYFTVLSSPTLIDSFLATYFASPTEQRRAVHFDGDRAGWRALDLHLREDQPFAALQSGRIQRQGSAVLLRVRTHEKTHAPWIEIVRKMRCFRSFVWANTFRRLFYDLFASSILLCHSLSLLIPPDVLVFCTTSLMYAVPH